MTLTEQEILRYSRHIILPEVGGRGQQRIKSASVLVAGLGAAGSAAALYLAAAGVGRLTLWDPAPLAEADLARAIAHDRAHLGLSRAASARGKVTAINPDADVLASAEPDALPGLVNGHQVVLATAGDWEAVQAAALRTGAVAVFAGVRGAAGAVFAHRPGEPCLGCVPPEAREAAGLQPEEGGGCAVARGRRGRRHRRSHGGAEADPGHRRPVDWPALGLRWMGSRVPGGCGHAAGGLRGCSAGGPRRRGLGEAGGRSTPSPVLHFSCDRVTLCWTPAPAVL